MNWLQTGLTIALFAAFATDNLTATESDSKGLVLRIESLKTRYVEGEAVWMIVTLSNQTGCDTSITSLDAHFNGILRFKMAYAGIERTSGFMWVCGGGGPPVGPLIKLERGEEFSRMVELSWLFGSALDWGIFPSIRPGGYEVSAVYRYRTADSSISNSLHLQIVDVPADLQPSWSALLAADSTTPPNHELRRAAFQRALYVNTSAPWAPRILDLLISLYDRPHEWELLIRMLNDYPDSPFCDEALYRLARLSGLEGFRRLIDHVLNPPSHSRLAALITQLKIGRVMLPLNTIQLESVAKELALPQSD